MTGMPRWRLLRRARNLRARWRGALEALEELQRTTEELRVALAEARSAIEELRRGVDQARGPIPAIEAAIGTLAEEQASVRQAAASLASAQTRSELHARIVPTTMWIEASPVPDDALVSVILPTRNRSRLLPNAIGSVLNQSYARWELLVVDDDSDDRTAQVLERFTDDRIRVLRGPGRGVSAARNLALEGARGTLIAYLDDDNLMHPQWLRSVVWAFAHHPDADVLYGARVVQDSTALGRTGDGRFADIHLEVYDRSRLERGNFIDLGTVVHRAGLPGARFDEDLASLVDWDLVLRLTRTKPPVTLPAIACLYATTSPGRLTGGSEAAAAFDAVVAKVQEARPLRVLGYNSMFPLISETYIQDEMEALAQQGADLAYYRKHEPMVEMPVDRALYTEVEKALEEFAPDVLFLYWLPWALEQLEQLEAMGLPFAVRAHSFDYDPAGAARLVGHPNCVGVWAFPDHAAAIPGAFTLPPLFTSVDQMPEPATHRDLVMSVSAGLPKKDWDLLLEAFCGLEGTERRIVLAHTKGFEHLPEDVARRAAGCADPPLVRADLPRREVFVLLAGAAALVYTLDPGQTFGMPMSVVEGLCAGASVILPDRPEAREFAGPHGRFYRTADDIVRHAREALAGGPAVEAEREGNREHGLRSFCDPSLGKRFFAELAEALDRWRWTRT
jgi:hypothetical protein